ncbi:hypothetical protein E2K93_13885 [Thalassotalea sp. HSM 43]|uniref:hypothetical protein n=1 Tax=Thalassotalea sp. HSM 43 TaxID=2552945 RepID=UPI001081CFC9|nr:hypothetical protein [Thalassotalea sp. HSM 43]QBY05399.1 hypothetical protein E2K93_13885 [Thalassotalea sp. HSM 43]
MKQLTTIFLSLLLILTSSYATAQTQQLEQTKQTKPTEATLHHKQRQGLHGMLLFSNGAELFASHLPMFHAPHDMQVIFSLTVQDKQLQHSLISQLAQQNTIWSIEPEAFDLSNLGSAQQLSISQFTANIYQGHFERGGVKRYTQQITVNRLIVKQVLSKSLPSQRHYQKITPDNQPIQYYALRIEGRPGIDHIIKVESEPTANNQRNLADDFSFPFAPQAPSDHAIAEKLAIKPEKVNTLYLETGDLK